MNSLFPILCELLWARLVRMLGMVCICKWFSCIIVKGVSQYPVRGVIGNGVADPFDVVAELAVSLSSVVL